MRELEWNTSPACVYAVSMNLTKKKLTRNLEVAEPSPVSCSALGSWCRRGCDPVQGRGQGCAEVLWAGGQGSGTSAGAGRRW